MYDWRQIPCTDHELEEKLAFLDDAETFGEGEGDMHQASAKDAGYYDFGKRSASRDYHAHGPQASSYTSLSSKERDQADDEDDPGPRGMP